MSDTFAVPVRQSSKECYPLEKNYIACLLQKGLKDRTFNNVCNMELVLFYHLECPDYVKKFDKNKDYLRRQIFNFLLTPYVNLKMLEKKLSEKTAPPNLNSIKREKYLPYPEEINIPTREVEYNLLKDDFLKNYVEGVSFTADKKVDAEPAADDE